MSTIDEAMQLLEGDLRPNQRIWLIERNKLGYWGVAVVRDLPEEEWPKPQPGTAIPDSDTWLAFAYRRESTLLEALVGVRNDVIRWNQENDDAEAEKKFTQKIDPDYIKDLAKIVRGE